MTDKLETDRKIQNDSWRHHWFPAVLQKFWTSDGNLSWLTKDGMEITKPYGRKRAGWIPYGHTAKCELFGDTNYEKPTFDIDCQIPGLVSIISKLFMTSPRKNCSVHILKGRNIPAFQKFGIANHYSISENTHRHLLELLFSLVNRSHFYRDQMESYPEKFGFDRDKNIGVTNLISGFKENQQIAKAGSLQHHRFLILRSKTERFIFGDGLQDWIVIRSSDHRLWGRLLVPLTPEICVFFSTPEHPVSKEAVMTLDAPVSVVDQINRITALQNRDNLFFKGAKPKMIIDKPLDTRWTVDPNYEPIILTLDDAVGYDEPRSHSALNKALADHISTLDDPKSPGGTVTIPFGSKTKGPK